jgi:sortase A
LRRARSSGTFPVATAALALGGSILLLAGLWIPTKAWIAQQLIARAWRMTLAGHERVLPWTWADTWPIAKLELPGTSRPLYVLAGANGQSLAFGPAHLSQSGHPGEADNVVIAGHRDTHFAALETLEIGDEIFVESMRGRTLYRVAATAIVHESRVDLIERTGRSELTLITCYPFDALVPGGPLRFVVFASAAEIALQPKDVPGLDITAAGL